MGLCRMGAHRLGGLRWRSRPVRLRFWRGFRLAVRCWGLRCWGLAVAGTLCMPPDGLLQLPLRLRTGRIEKLVERFKDRKKGIEIGAIGAVYHRSASQKLQLEPTAAILTVRAAKQLAQAPRTHSHPEN